MTIDVNGLVMYIAQAANGFQIGVACWPVTANYEAVVLSPWLDIRPSEQHRTGAFARTAGLNFSDYGGRAVHGAEALELGFLVGIFEALARPVIGRRAVGDFIHVVEHREWSRWMVDTMDGGEKGRGGTIERTCFGY